MLLMFLVWSWNCHVVTQNNTIASVFGKQKQGAHQAGDLMTYVRSYLTTGYGRGCWMLRRTSNDQQLVVGYYAPQEAINKYFPLQDPFQRWLTSHKNHIRSTCFVSEIQLQI